MKIRTDASLLFASVGLSALIGLGFVGYSGPVAAQPPAPARRPGKPPRPEQHRNITAALSALINARDKLQHAQRDFGGHRQKALDHVNAAISELNAALASDSK